MRRVLIIGATSAIAEETTRRFAAEGSELFLVGRNESRLTSIASDLHVRGAGRVGIHTVDLNDLELHPQILDEAYAFLGEIDGVLVAHGILPNQTDCEQSVESLLESYQTNCLSVLSILTLLGTRFQYTGGGCIAVISSVAGDRGRASNYAYGAAKAAVSVFSEGLRVRLYPHGVRVVTIKPGLVDSPMTRALPKNFLFSSTAQVGRTIHRAMQSNKSVVYAPWYWRWVMLAIRSIPDRLFRKLRF